MRIHCPRTDAAERTEVHDAPGAVFLHEQSGLLAAKERGFEIHVVDEIPVGFGELERIAAAEASGVVDQSIQRSELLFYFPKHALDIVNFFEVGLEERR